MDILYYFILGVVSGVLVGLIPGLSVWTTLAVLLPFVHSMEFWQVMIIWAGGAIGSQYFGSVATILFRVPGENSSLIFYKDVDFLSGQEKLDLIKSTAYGSFVASVAGFAMMYFMYTFALDLFNYLSSNNFKLTLYIFLFALLTLTAEKKWLAAILFLVGLFFSKKGDLSLEGILFQVQYYTQDLTLFSMIVALAIIPEIFSKQTDSIRNPRELKTIKQISFVAGTWIRILKGTTIGILGGMIPGQSATMSSILAYNSERKSSRSQRIVSSESADNSAIIMGMVPLLLIGLPISMDHIILLNILAIQLVDAPFDFLKEIRFGLDAFEGLVIVGLMFSLVFLFLSQRFLRVYYYIVKSLYARGKVLLIAIAGWIIYMDVKMHPIGDSYLIFLVIFSIIGVILQRKQISPVPLLIGFMLGDHIYWALSYFINTL